MSAVQESVQPALDRSMRALLLLPYPNVFGAALCANATEAKREHKGLITMAVATRLRYKPRKCKGLGCSVIFIPTKRDHIYHADSCRWYMANRKRRNGNGKSK